MGTTIKNGIAITRLNPNAGGGGATSVTYGYLYDGAFYEDAAHTLPIAVSKVMQYIDISDANSPRQYSWTGTEFVLTSGVIGFGEEEAIASALVLLNETVSFLRSGRTDRGYILVTKDLAKTDSEVQGSTKYALGIAYGRFLKELSDTNEEVIANALNALNALSAIASAVVPQHKTSKAYVVGDIVSYEGWFYECIVAHTGLWDATKWERITLIDYIKKYFSPLNS